MLCVLLCKWVVFHNNSLKPKEFNKQIYTAEDISDLRDRPENVSRKAAWRQKMCWEFWAERRERWGGDNIQKNSG